jgi:hypothetical protein
MQTDQVMGLRMIELRQSLEFCGNGANFAATGCFAANWRRIAADSLILPQFSKLPQSTPDERGFVSPRWARENVAPYGTAPIARPQEPPRR